MPQSTPDEEDYPQKIVPTKIWSEISRAKLERYARDNENTLRTSAFQKETPVPLVVYVGPDGKLTDTSDPRPDVICHVIGEAWVKDQEIMTQMGPEAGTDILDALYEGSGRQFFSLGFVKPPQVPKQMSLIDFGVQDVIYKNLEDEKEYLREIFNQKVADAIRTEEAFIVGIDNVDILQNKILSEMTLTVEQLEEPLVVEAANPTIDPRDFGVQDPIYKNLEILVTSPLEEEKRVLKQEFEKSITQKLVEHIVEQEGAIALVQILNCTCSWNHNYMPPGILPSHHISCPSLKGHHDPEDECGPGGHRV